MSHSLSSSAADLNYVAWDAEPKEVCDIAVKTLVMGEEALQLALALEERLSNVSISHELRNELLKIKSMLVSQIADTRGKHAALHRKLTSESKSSSPLLICSFKE